MSGVFFISFRNKNSIFTVKILNGLVLDIIEIDCLFKLQKLIKFVIKSTYHNNIDKFKIEVH